MGTGDQAFPISTSQGKNVIQLSLTIMTKNCGRDFNFSMWLLCYAYQSQVGHIFMIWEGEVIANKIFLSWYLASFWYVITYFSHNVCINMFRSCMHDKDITVVSLHNTIDLLWNTHIIHSIAQLIIVLRFMQRYLAILVIKNSEHTAKSTQHKKWSHSGFNNDT